MYLSKSLIASYPFYSQDSTGGPSIPEFAAVNEAYGQELPNKNLKLGQYIEDRDGNFFQIVRARAGLTIGQVVIPSANVTGTAITAAGIADNIHIIKTNLSAAITVANQEVGNYLVFVISATSTIAKKILAHTAWDGANVYYTVSKKDIRFGRGDYDGNAFASAVANGVVCHLVRPHNVIVSLATALNGATAMPVGIAQGTVTDTYVTAVQVHGFGLVSSDGDTNPVVDNKIMTLSETAGAVSGPPAAGVGLADLLGYVGIGKIANAGGAGAFSYGFIDLFGRW
jgi:hypothetical protein